LIKVFAYFNSIKIYPLNFQMALRLKALKVKHWDREVENLIDLNYIINRISLKIVIT